MPSNIGKYYEFMEIAPSCSDIELRRAYRKLAKLFHPDKDKSTGSQQKFDVLNRVYSKLQSHRKRLQLESRVVSLSPVAY